MTILTNLASLPSFVGRANTGECTDAIDARRPVSARLRSTFVYVDSAVRPVEARRADAPKPAVARLAGPVVVTRSRGAQIRRISVVAVVRRAVIYHRFAQRAGVAVRAEAVKSVDHVHAFAILTWIVGTLVNVAFAFMACETGHAVALIIIH